MEPSSGTPGSAGGVKKSYSDGGFELGLPASGTDGIPICHHESINLKAFLFTLQIVLFGRKPSLHLVFSNLSNLSEIL